MPEGDTICRTARTLQRALGGRVVTKFTTVLPLLARVDDQSPLAGRTIERVHAVGKHLLIDFSGGLTLRTHMRMNGSWHIYRSGEKWQRPRVDMRIVIETDAFVAVGFTIPDAEFTNDTPQLGPDLLGDSFDMNEALRRVRERASEEIGNVLLNQQVVAGIGNIWKSESLHAAGVNPFRHVSELDDATIANILSIARKQLRASANATMRVRHAVYQGKLCRKCGSRIEYRKQGEGARGTYWCPKCQG
ncbi:MAG TPA: DNA-formamidopyrimidine glycosylase family protein [Thermoanaerobaculia bacterium]|nr:DNA-formamidopyrimidine glycosylase family protein [Thermoanaerobaculia bacterium]